MSTSLEPAPAHSLGSDLLATAALALYSVAVAAGYARVFGAWDFLEYMLVLILVGHGSGLVLRRLRIPGWIAAPLTAVLLGWTIGLLYYRFTYSMLLPTAETLDLFRIELGLVREQFRSAVAPVLYGGGWDVLAAIGVAASVLLADVFAFRAFARAEALVPGGVLFVFVAALGTDRSRVALAVVLVAAGALATIVLRAYHAPRAPAAARGRNPIRLALPAAVGTALVVALVAGVVGPRLPGASAEPIYDTRGGGGGNVTEIVSPLVDIRSRLTNRSNAEMFVVQSTDESYWRSSALPRFDGTTWGLPKRPLSTAGGGLAAARTGTVEVRQRVRIVNLGGSLVPAAADPTNVSPSENLRWSADTSTLVTTDRDLERGDTFDIVSAAPRFDPATLSAATSTDAGDPIYLELPADWPDDATATARRVVGEGASAYDAALALQNWFRDPDEWRYSLEVQSGHGTNAIEVFLRERVGYCEQFAGTYAAMMRSLGFPARVSVGFTTGTDLGGGSYSVLGKNAHAWPEVWFDGLGWVQFEPTPGRGAPGAESYTQVAPQQDTSGVSPDAPREQPEDDPTVTTLPDDPQSPTDGPLNIPQEDLTATDSLDSGEVLAPQGSGSGSGPATALLLLALVVVLAPAAVRRWRRRRPRPVDARLANLWQQALDSLADLGIDADATRTPLELATATARNYPVVARPITSLAEVVTEATYSATGSADYERPSRFGRTTIRSCAHWCTQIERAVRDSLGPAARIRRHFTRWR